MIPKYLYKYQPSLDKDEHGVTNLQNHQIYYPHPNEFDDPYDCALQIMRDVSETDVNELWEKWKKGEIHTEHPYDKYYSQYTTDGKPNEKFRNANIGTIKMILAREREKILTQWGISCFSANNDNLLMWAHYGSGHKGYCLEFDTSEPLFKNASPVTYPSTEEIPSYSPVDILTGKENAVQRMTLIKAPDWAYQEEWRIFCEKGDTVKNYEENCLTKVFFGAKSSRDDQIKIIKAIGNCQTKFFIMEPDSELFEVKPVEYEKWLGKQSDFVSG